MDYKNLKFENLFRLINIIHESKTKDIGFIYQLYKRHCENFDGSMKMLMDIKTIHLNGNKLSLIEDPFSELDEMTIKSRKKFRDLIIKKITSVDLIKEDIKSYISEYSIIDDYGYGCELEKENSLKSIPFRNFLMTLDLIEFDRKNSMYFVSDLFLKLINNSTLSRNFSLKQLEERIDNNQRIGALAEDAVVEYEIARLSKHLPIPETLVKKISEDNVNAGYDIDSHLINDNDNLIEIKIEVKAVSATNYRFYWSKNEMKSAKIYGDRYYLYLIPFLGKDEFDLDKMKIIQDPFKGILRNDSWSCEVESASFHWTHK